MSTVPAAHLSRRLVATLTLLVFSTAGTIHYQTPMLGQIGSEFHAEPDAVGWIATLSFAGYLAGTVFLVPLGDRFDKRKLILGHVVGLVAALLALAAAPTLLAAAALSFLVGVCAGVSQHVVPLVSELAHPQERGRAVGTVLSGLFVGLLFARVVGGQVASHLDWRWMYVLGAGLVAAVGCAAFALVPSVAPKTRLGYVELLRSLFGLLARHARLRHPSAIQFFLGICYGGFWATLAAMLMLLHGLGPSAAGLIGIPGAAGILVARPAGRWMDRHGAAPVVSAGITVVLAAFVVLGFAAASIVAVIVGAAILDCGLRATIVANQTVVTTVVPEARSRANTIFAAHMWGGNAVGAFLASAALTRWGWLAVCAVAVAASIAALSLAIASSRSLAAGAQK